MRQGSTPAEELEKIIEKKYHRQDHKKSKTMKVSGKSVFKLREIVKKKNKG